MPVINTQGIVIRMRNMQEADRIVTIYTKSKGKVKAAANGARRTRNRLRESTQLFCVSEFSLYLTSGLARINQAQIRQPFNELREDLDKMAYASYFSELVDVLVEEGEANEELYHFLINTLSALQHTGERELLSTYFSLHLLGILGYGLQTQVCAECGSALPIATYKLSPSAGGLLCENCVADYHDIIRLEAGAVRLLEHLGAANFSRLHILRPSAAMLKQTSTVLGKLLEIHLPSKLRSLDFLNLVTLR